MTAFFQHTPITSPAELSAVLALFPKCSACGAALSVAEPIIADPGHAFRVRHCGPCPCAPLSAA